VSVGDATSEAFWPAPSLLLTDVIAPALRSPLARIVTSPAVSPSFRRDGILQEVSARGVTDARLTTAAIHGMARGEEDLPSCRTKTDTISPFDLGGGRNAVIIGERAAGEFGQVPYGKVADAAVSGDVG
jgi:hypothetical protein